MVRWIVYGVPLALLALVGAAFISTNLLPARRVNEMSIGMLGEASNLNPILAADAAASQVGSMIFQALLTVDEDMNLRGELAESWELAQDTSYFFSEVAAAEHALELALAFRKNRAAGELLAAVVEPEAGLFCLRLRLAEPGVEFSGQLARQFPAALDLREIEVLLPGGSGPERMAGLRASGTVAGAVRWFSEGARSFSVTVAGDPAPAIAAIGNFLENAGEVAIEPGEETRFLAEPEVRFQLRQGIRWQDGAPFTSDDVLFTYEAIMDDAIASPRKSDFTLIGEVLTPSEHEVVVRYRKPYSPALNSWRMSIIPAHILRGQPREWWSENFNRRPVGTGPFRFAEWKTNEYIRVERNPDYWQAPGPWLDAVVFRVLPDPLTLRLAFETRQVDFWSVDPWAVRSFLEDPRFQLFTAPSSSYTYIGWNLRRPMFQDDRVRRALAHAVDVGQMIKYLLYGYGVQSTGIFTPEMWFFDPTIQPLPHDPDRARELLAEAGWQPGPDGILQKDGMRFSFTLITNNANEVRRDIATLVQDDLRRVGIEVRIELYEWAVFLTRFINKGDFDAMVLGWSLPRDDFDQFQIWHSSQSNPEQLNVVGYKNAEVDRLLQQIRQEFRRDKVKELAAALQQTIYADQPYLFLFVPEGTSVMWRDAFRVCRPDGAGGWIREPVRMTKAGWSFYLEWFYRPEYSDLLPPEAQEGGNLP